jgi:hypothetical protein
MRLAVPAALLALALVLLGGIAWALLAPLAPVPVAAFRPPKNIARASDPPATPPSDTFAAIDTRPLFSMNRRPLADSALPGSATAASSDFSLVGVLGGGDRFIALLRSKSTSQSFTVSAGDVVNGWRVAKIDPTAVTLTSATGAVVVGMDAPGSAPPTAPLQPLTAAAPLQPAPQPAAAATPPLTTASPAPAAPSPATAAAPAPGTKPAKSTIAPDALKGAPIDPRTGEPTL